MKVNDYVRTEDEIKEILEALDNTACCSYHDDMCKKAKNYITNLQQENEIKTTKLNEIERLNNTFNKIAKIIDSDEYFGDKYDCIVYLITKDERYLSQYTPEELINIINGGDVE